jgi:Zn-dependent protease with chaperone function
MTDNEFETLVARLEPFARNEPASYRRRVIGLALLGDVYLWCVLLLLLTLIGVSLWFIAVLKVLALKLLIVLLPIVWLLGKALWVVLPAPQGIRVSRRDAPELFAMIDDIGQRIGAPAFHEVIIDGEFNAAVVQSPRLGAFGWFKNYLIIGLPLLKSLTPEQFKAVLAHEYGHLAGGHAKLSNWIYRQRLRWSRLLTSLEANGGEGGVLFMGFLKRYAPYLNAYSFPLARANEYEADAVAVRTTDATSMAQALTAVNVGSSYLSETFWPGIYRRASHVPAPESTPYVSLSTSLHADETSMPSARWLEQAMKVKTSVADTHPSLTDRLGAIGAAPGIALPAPGQAADQLLGTSLDVITQKLDSEWSQRVADAWRMRFEEASKDRDALAAFEARRSNGEALDLDDAFARALLLDNAADNLPESVAALRDLYAQHPEENKVAIALGTRLLFQEDETGVAMLETVIARDATSAVPCGQAIHDFYRRHDRNDEADAVVTRINALAAGNREADEERAEVRPNDRFVPHGLDDIALEKLKQQFANINEIGDVYLVQKQCEHQPERKNYVVGFTIKNKWLGDKKPKINAAMIAMRTQVTYPGETMIIAFDANNEFYLKCMKGVTGARVV